MQEQSEIKDYGGVVRKDIKGGNLSDAIQEKYFDENTTFYVNRFANDHILKADAGKYKKFIEKNQKLIGKNVSFYDKGTCAGNYINNVVFHNDGIDLASFRPGFNNYVIRHFIIDKNNNKFILDGVSVCDDTSQRNSTNIKQPTHFFKRPEDTELSQEYDEYFSKNCFMAHENIYNKDIFENDDSKKKEMKNDSERVKMKKEDFDGLLEKFKTTTSFDEYCSQRCKNNEIDASNFKQSVLFDIEQVLNVNISPVCNNIYKALCWKYFNFINEQVDKFIKENERAIWQHSLLRTQVSLFYQNGKINTTILSDEQIKEIEKDIEQQLDKSIQYCEVDPQDRKNMKDSIWNGLCSSFVSIINTKWYLFVKEKNEQKKRRYMQRNHYIAAPLYQRNQNNANRYNDYNDRRKKYNKCQNRLSYYRLPHNNMLYPGYY